MSGLITNIIPHYMTEEELTAEFGENEPVRKKYMAYLIMKQIQAIYREEGKFRDLSSEEQLKQRQVIIRPLVDALFVKQNEHEVAKNGKLRDGFIYIMNQERYLRVLANVPFAASVLGKGTGRSLTLESKVQQSSTALYRLKKQTI